MPWVDERACAVPAPTVAGRSSLNSARQKNQGKTSEGKQRRVALLLGGGLVLMLRNHPLQGVEEERLPFLGRSKSNGMYSTPCNMASCSCPIPGCTSGITSLPARSA
jgi:hypothetical protein